MARHLSEKQLRDRLQRRWAKLGQGPDVEARIARGERPPEDAQAKWAAAAAAAAAADGGGYYSYSEP